MAKRKHKELIAALLTLVVVFMVGGVWLSGFMSGRQDVVSDCMSHGVHYLGEDEAMLCKRVSRPQ